MFLGTLEKHGAPGWEFTAVILSRLALKSHLKVTAKFPGPAYSQIVVIADLSAGSICLQLPVGQQGQTASPPHFSVFLHLILLPPSKHFKRLAHFHVIFTSSCSHTWPKDPTLTLLCFSSQSSLRALFQPINPWPRTLFFYCIISQLSLLLDRKPHGADILFQWLLQQQKNLDQQKYYIDFCYRYWTREN